MNREIMKALFIVFGVGGGALLFYFVKSEAPAPLPECPSALPLPPPIVVQKESDRPQAEKAPVEPIERCEAGGGIPVVGHDWAVVCLKPGSAEWFEVPRFGGR